MPADAAPSSLAHLAAYLAEDRRAALLAGTTIAPTSEGAALLADIRGFTALTEELSQRLGPWEGSEELTRQVNACFSVLIDAIELYRGAVVRFSGDGLIAVYTGQH